MLFKSESNKSVLIIHSQLAQHGSERFMYEVAKVLTDNGHNVDILTRPFFIKKQYYYEKFIEIGSKIHNRLITLRHINFFLRKLKIKVFPPSHLTRVLYRCLSKILFQSILKKYDFIYVIGLETYCDSLAPLSYGLRKQLNIQVFDVMHDFQRDRDYSLEYNLNEVVVIDRKQELELNQSMPTVKCKKFSLLIDFDSLRKYNFDSGEIDFKRRALNIGVVSRLSLDRPNEIIFRYFSELNKLFNVHLHWFGGGDKDLYSQICKKLSISKDTISFHGHSSNILYDLKENNVDLCWQTCMGLSLNYAPIELMGQGFPVYLINIDPKFYSVKDHPCKIAISFSDVISFHKQIISNKHSFKDVVNINKNYVVNLFGTTKAYEKLKNINAI